jgi:hypothetical protein
MKEGEKEVKFGETRGYLALLDVLGFSELIARESRTEELTKYFEAVDTATSKEVESVDYVLFSDTIVITSQTNTEASLLGVLRACSYVMHYLLKEGLPIRGAVPYGQFTRNQNPKGVLIAGAAFLEAYRFEKAQNWVGIVITPSVLRVYPKLNERCQMIPAGPGGSTSAMLENQDWMKIVQRHRAIPWHASEGSWDGFAILPTAPGWTFQHMSIGLGEVAEWLEKQRLLASDPGAQQKYDAPISWIINQLAPYWGTCARFLLSKGIDEKSAPGLQH